MTIDTATWVQAGSAAVQAIAAAIIVVLTYRLSRIAADALRASRDQADSAAAALAEMQAQRAAMRRQSVLAELPTLDVSKPRGEFGSDVTLVTVIHLANAGPAPALGVILEVRAEDSPGKVGQHVYARDNLSMVVPGESVELQVDSRDLFDMGFDSTVAQGQQARGEVPSLYSRDRLILDITFRTPLGAEVSQRYGWHANEPAGADQALVWRLLHVRIRPDPSDEGDVIEVPLPI